MRLLVLALFIAAHSAEEPRQLDPRKPADAWEIVAMVVAKSQMTVADAQAVLIAVQTLKPASPPAPSPVEPAKVEGTKP